MIARGILGLGRVTDINGEALAITEYLFPARRCRASASAGAFLCKDWRPAAIGAFAGLALLALMVLALGPLLDQIPLHLLQLVIGVLLLLFGMR